MGLDLPEFDVRSKIVTGYLAGTKKKLHHSKNPALTPAVPVTQEYPRRDLKGLYPGFTIDGRGDVWMPNGERAPTRFRRKQEWVYLYDAANHRKERSVYWLMELVGFVDESRAKKPRTRAPAWAAFYNSLDEAHGEDAESSPNPNCRKKCCAGLN